MKRVNNNIVILNKAEADEIKNNVLHPTEEYLRIREKIDKDIERIGIEFKDDSIKVTFPEYYINEKE